MNKKAISISLALLFGLFNQAKSDDIMINNINIDKKQDKITISPFDYAINGQQKKSPGATFSIKATPLKNDEKTMNGLLKGYSNGLWVFMPHKLPVRKIVDIELKKKESGEILKLNEDFFLNHKGAIMGWREKGGPIKDKSIFQVTYSYHLERYDSIFLNPQMGALKIIEGQDRDCDAEEYIPETPDQLFHICNIMVNGKELTILPVYQKENYIVPGDLANFTKKVKAGKPVKLLGYGDSITAIEGGRHDYQPNNKVLDDGRLFFKRFPKDTIKKIETFDFDDGQGKVHCKVGWNWSLKKKIEDKYGIKVTYYNCGFGGTRSDNAKNGGLYPERLKLALDVKPDLVVLAFGMNELGKDITEKNISELVDKFRANGADVIIMGMPQINGKSVTERHTKELTDGWKKTIDILRKVAKEKNCPFVDTEKIDLGIAPEHRCSSNLINHPGINEMKIYSNMLEKVID